MSVNVTTNALIVWRNNFKLNTLKSQIYVKLQNLDRDLKTKDAVTMNKKLSALSIALMICGFIWCTIWLFVYNAIAMNTFCVPLTIILSANVGNWLEMVLLFIIFYFVNTSTMVDSMLCMLPALLLMLTIFFSLCVIAEALTSKLDITKKLCAMGMHSFTDDISRRNSKQIVLLLKAKRPLSVFKIYTLGTRLPIHLLGVTASYTIVLLQFAVL
ncbi:uncharacterized protein LOC134200035 [Bombyx mori]|uniref:uncharacterized protein LOC134200035 n=1 Tax=Bombyx mori TaxID=7091 RepID=UPI002ECFAE73